MRARIATTLSAVALALLPSCAPVNSAKSPAQEPAAIGEAAPKDPAAWRLAIPTPGVKSTLSFPTPHLLTLENGLRLYSLPTQASTLSLSVVIRHDVQTLPNDKPGLAALTARLLTEGTTVHPDLKLAEAIEALGTDFTVDTGRDGTTISIEALPADLDAALKLLAEVAIKPAFSPKTFDRVRAQWVDNVRESLQDPRSLSSIIGFEALLGKGLGTPVHGYPDALLRYTVQDIVRCHSTVYLPGNASLNVVGDFDPTTLTKLVQKHFGEWRKRAGAQRPILPTLPAATTTTTTTHVLLLDRPRSPQSAIFVAHTLPARGAPGYAERELLVTAFGGLFTSRLNQNLRESKAYTYGAFGNYLATRHFGALAISTSVETKFTADAVREIVRELSDLGLPTTPRPLVSDEVDRARADIVHSLVEHLGHTNRISADLVQLFVHDLPLDQLAKLTAEIQAVPLDALRRTATELIKPTTLTIAIVGDAASIRPALNALGYPVKDVQKLGDGESLQPSPM